ncbi:MAG TPA: DUF3142 domain-containing protein, partial [Pyrinomonadaceae bacterium]|nr:DUF3142 domain-containing protein [Pyrinomonadaceae bacterium]
HLVYNGTRRFLREWEKLTPDDIAATVAETYRADLIRAHNDNANVVGIQLDLDSPERLLGFYSQVLKRLRQLLPAGTKLSITGLPTWMSSNEISLVLSDVDFWIPQFYGAAVPTNINQRIPISNASEVAKNVTRARGLDKLLYAGLAAYSYAILYGKDGELLEMRGDIDPVLAAENGELEPIRSQTFKGAPETTETRYAYRAKSEIVLDGLIIEPGEILVFDLPSASSLRAAARAVRENAGDRLLGICVFRLPTTNDAATLSTGEIAAALADVPDKTATAITLRQSGQKLKILAENIGTTGAALADDALTVDLSVSAGSVKGVTGATGFNGYETLCRIDQFRSPLPCSELRANVIRLKANAWRPGATAAIELKTNSELTGALPVLITTRINGGRVVQEPIEVKIQNDGN